MTSINFSVFSQPYKSYFGENYTKWNIWNYDTGFITRTFLSCCGREEIIEGKTYNCLFEIFEDDDVTYVDSNKPCFHFLREERETGRLYYRNKLDGKFYNELSAEVIVSDMSLEVEDRIPLAGNRHIWHYDNNTEYEIVDSIYYQNDLKHIRTKMYFNNSYVNKDTLTFIEGIGSNIGPMLGYDGVHARSVGLACYHKDGDITYFPQDYFSQNKECVKFTPDGFESPAIKMEYIISKNEISILFPINYTGDIFIYNSMGHLISHSIVSEASQCDIRIKTIPGVYFLRLQEKKGRASTKKIMIN